MLCQPIRRADDVEAIFGRPILVGRSCELLNDRIRRLIGMQRVRNRALEGFVVLWERAIRKGPERSKDAAHAFGIHDERTHVVFGV